MIVFVSYSSTSRDAVETLVLQLGELGHDVEYEIKFVGAPITWRHVFTSITSCDLFITAVTRETLISSTCEIEYQYARSLNKNIVAVLLEDLNTEELPDMKVKGLVDFRVDTPFAQMALAEAINSLPTPVSPPDVAIPPANWVTPLAELRKRIENLPRDAREQRAVMLNVKEFLERRESFEVASTLLDLLAVQPGLRQLTANQIQYIRGELKQIRASTRGARRRRTLVGAIVLSAVVALVAVVFSQLFFRFRANYNVELSMTRTAETMVASDIAASASTTSIVPTLEFSSTATDSQPAAVAEVASLAAPISLATNTPFIPASTATSVPPTSAPLPSFTPSVTAIPLTAATEIVMPSMTAIPLTLASVIVVSSATAIPPTQTLPAVTVVASTQAASANGQRVNIAHRLPTAACMLRCLYRSIT